MTGYGYSSTAYYRCNYGYDLHGSYSRKCQHDGTWYGSAPECRKAKRGKKLTPVESYYYITILTITSVTCSKLDAPRYGNVWVTSDSYSSTAYYSCNYGYELDGSYSRKCQHDGTWYGKAPECRKARRGKQLTPFQSHQSTPIIIPAVTCSKLDAPRYGKVSVTGYSYSSTAYYTCDYGYELDGSHSRKCQHDGTWYGKAPECRKAEGGKDNAVMQFHLHQDLSFTHIPTVNCPNVNAPRYGKVWVTGYSYSSTAYYSCDYGYELHGSYSRKCQHDRTWYGKAPECRQAKRGKCS